MHQKELLDEPLILAEVAQSPRDLGRLEAIVLRPSPNQRAVMSHGELTCESGLVGDDWSVTTRFRLADDSADSRSQLTLINARLLRSLAGGEERMSLAGDQLVVDLDLSIGNLPVGQRLQIGGAIIEISDIPHNGCHKFRARYGDAALHLVNSPRGKSLRLRGAYARVVQPGRIGVGDAIVKIK
jgi:hypothetical protein